LEDQDVEDIKTDLKVIWDGCGGLDFNREKMALSCERHNETLGFTKCLEFLDNLRNC